MKRVVDLLGAFLTALVLCILPARADAMSGGVLVVGLLGIVLIIAIVAVAASLLVRAVGRLRAKRKDENREER